MRIRTLIDKARTIRSTAATLPSVQLCALYLTQANVTEQTTFDQLGLSKHQINVLREEGIVTVDDALLWPSVAFVDLFRDNVIEGTMVVCIISQKFDFPAVPLGIEPERFIKHYGTLENVPMPAVVRHLFIAPDEWATIGDYLQAKDKGRVNAFMRRYWGGASEDADQMILLEVEGFIGRARA